MDASDPAVEEPPAGRHAWLLWLLVAAIVAGLGLVAYRAVQKVRQSSVQKAMLGNLRQLSAALDQVTLEEGYRIFFRYDEVVGRDRYIKAQQSVAGESYAEIFPTRSGVPLTATAPNGLSVSYDPDGPLPSPRADGVITTSLAGGRRYETTWQGGVPHGAFRAYYADGKLWGEATYEHGRLVGPAWLHTRDGRRFDELKDGRGAVAAIMASLQSVTRDGRAEAERRLRQGDHAGAEKFLTAALAVDSENRDLYRLRAQAFEAQGNLDGAIADLVVAEGYSPDMLGHIVLPDQLQQLVYRRALRHRDAGRAAEAREDFRALAVSAIGQADRLLRQRQAKPVVAEINRIEPHFAVAELLAARAEAHRILGDFAAAEADYTRAMELAARGEMQTAANQRVLPAHWQYKRAHVRRWQGRLDAAAEDFRACRPQLGFAATIQQPEAAMWLFLVRCEAGARVEAALELAALDKPEWHPNRLQAARVLLGELPPGAYTSPPNSAGDDLIVATYLRVSGDEAAALALFRKVRPSGWYDALDLQLKQFALRGVSPAPPPNLP